MTTGHEQSKSIALFTAVAAFVIVNAAFYFLSGNYFDAHHQIVGGTSVPAYSPAQAMHIRVVFAVVSGVLVAVGFAAALQRRVVGHALAALLGVANLVGGVAALTHGLPGALVATQIVIGLVMPALAWQSYRRVRAAWSFLVAMCGVLALADLFGAPKIRGVLDVSLWATMIIPGLYAVACVTLAQLSADYVDRGAGSDALAH